MNLKELLRVHPPEGDRWKVRLKTIGWDLIRTDEDVWTLHIYVWSPKAYMSGPGFIHTGANDMDEAIEWSWRIIADFLGLAGRAALELMAPLETLVGKSALERVCEG